MVSSELFRVMVDEREREVRHLVRVRALLSSRQPERAVAAVPPRERRARGR